MISYAQNFEDVLLERLFQNKKRGFYVDVGAWDPNQYSVTRHFYDRGWRGVNVEPIARRHELFVSRRPRDINLCRVIGRNPSTRRFFECLDADYLSTMMADIADDLRKAGHEVAEYDVEVETLDEIFEKYSPKVVDFLKVDTEGSEAEVLGTLDLTRYRPRALIVESTVPGSGLKSWDEPNAFGTWHEWEQGVLDAGYHFAHFDGLNRFYVRREDRKLAARFAIPPGIFDGIDCSVNWQTRAVERLDVIDRQQAELTSVRETSEAVIAELRQSIDVGEADRVARGEVIDGLVEQLAAVEHDRAARLSLIERLTADLSESGRALEDAERAAATRIEAVEADRIARGEVIDGLVEQLAAVKRDRAAQLSLTERLTTDLDENRRALEDAERAAAMRIEAIEVDRIARGVTIDRLVEQLAAVERDKSARLSLIDRLTTDLGQNRVALDDAERQAASRLEAVEADRVARGEVIRGLVDQLAAVERDHAALLNLIERLTTQLEEGRRALESSERSAAARIEMVEADRVVRGDVMNELVGQLTAVERDRAARLTLIERLTADLSSSRRALEDADRAAAMRIEAVEADRVARGEVIAELIERLKAADTRSDDQKSLIARLDEAVRGGERRIDACERAISERDSELSAKQRAGDDLRGQLLEAEKLTLQRLHLIDRKDEQLSQQAALLAAASAEIAVLRRRWPRRIYSYFMRRA